jgi:alkylation response protein AidB-like acyl-CoA dehydrogenase
MAAIHADPDRHQQLEMLRSSAASFTARESPLSRARALRAQPPGFDPAFWSALAAQGWTGMLAPESQGGYAQGLTELAEVAAALAAQAAPEPITPVVVFAGRLLQGCGRSEAAAGLLGQLAEGLTLPAVAWQEDPTGAAAFDRTGALAEPASVCVRGDNGWNLRGGKRHVRPGAAASGFIVSATSPDGLVLAWVPAGSDGLTSTDEQLADGSYSARLAFNGVEVSPGHLLAQGAAAQAALATAYDETLVLASVELLAVSRRMLSMTLDYLRTRRQFGKLIGTFQGLQHRAVDLLIQQELSAAVVAQAVSEIDRGCSGGERALMAARVKARCSDAALTVARECVQMHGAIGVTDEYDLGLYLQRALVLSAWLGNSGVQRRRYAAMSRQAGATAGAPA